MDTVSICSFDLKYLNVRFVQEQNDYVTMRDILAVLNVKETTYEDEEEEETDAYDDESSALKETVQGIKRLSINVTIDSSLSPVFSMMNSL